jgi:hypothetical protein
MSAARRRCVHASRKFTNSYRLPVGMVRDLCLVPVQAIVLVRLVTRVYVFRVPRQFMELYDAQRLRITDKSENWIISCKYTLNLGSLHAVACVRSR